MQESVIHAPLPLLSTQDSGRNHRFCLQEHGVLRMEWQHHTIQNSAIVSLSIGAKAVKKNAADKFGEYFRKKENLCIQEDAECQN